MIKKINAVILSLLFVLSLSGCASKINVSDMAIVQAVGIDKIGTKTYISVQYLDLAKSTGKTDSMSQNITSVAVGKGDSIGKAIEDLRLGISNPLFFGQNKIIVLGNDYATKNVGDSLDYLLRGVDSRPDVLIAMSEGRAYDVISNPQRNARIPAKTLFDLIQNGEEQGYSIMVSVSELLDMYSNSMADIYLPVLVNKKDYVVLGGVAIFSDNKYAKTLTLNEAFGLLIIENRLKTGYLVVNDEKLGEVGVNILKCQNNNGFYTKNKELCFVSKIKLDFAIKDVEKGITNKLSPEDISHIEKEVSHEAQHLCLASFNACTKAKSDVLMLNNYLAKNDIYSYRTMQKSWRDNLKNINYSAYASSNLEIISDNAIG